ncbi:MAG: RlmE family RNA methyltransferase [Myxococcales bacterium]|nr:RlmE family RNA methyltransferase [Myxococcales bacterium]
MSRKRRGRENPYRRPDHHTRAAKAAGFAARSVFKLEEIDRRARLLKPGQHVLDLGAAPGSWSAYAASRIGRPGVLVAIDLKPMQQALGGNAHIIEGDAYDEVHVESGLIGEHAPYDVVLSDMAPNTTGHRATDQIRSFDVFMRALSLAKRLGKPGSSFVGKIFMSGHFPDAREAVRLAYEDVKVLKPEAVRDVSYEIFLVGMGLREHMQPKPDEETSCG